ncbi:MAG: hypothetical protein C4560_02220 [Nitrospiraceae bacterium]|nr:MAG: hypothetical protein C4560_02220 [Nitrospiraceae bacterium]
MKDIMKLKTTKWLAIYLAMAILIIGSAQNVCAGFAPSRIGPEGGHRTEDLRKIQSVIESKMVGERLTQLGFTAEEVKGKPAGLSDDQLHDLAVQLDELKVGGNVEVAGILGLVH